MFDFNYIIIIFSVSLAIGFVGVYDDLFRLRQSMKALIPFALALPSFHLFPSDIFLPIFGIINLGVFVYLLAPFGITCGANASNMLEGFNGLGVGLGIIISSSLIVMAFFGGLIVLSQGSAVAPFIYTLF